MAAEDINTVIKKLKDDLQAHACALVSRDGLVLSAEVPNGVYTETFAIMCATILGAAATANTELSRAPPEQIVVEGADSKTLIVGSGKKALLVAVVGHEADTHNSLKELILVAEQVKSG